jgi:hypothetical protein
VIGIEREVRHGAIYMAGCNTPKIPVVPAGTRVSPATHTRAGRMSTAPHIACPHDMR